MAGRTRSSAARAAAPARAALVERASRRLRRRSRMKRTRLGRIAFAAAAVTLGAAALGVPFSGAGARPQSAAAYPPAAASSLRGKIAFNGFRGGIWVMNADGSGRRKITNPPLAPQGATDYDPSWLPDGKRIVFRTDRGHYVRDESGS